MSESGGRNPMGLRDINPHHVSGEHVINDSSLWLLSA